MANKPYENCVIEAKLEDLYTTKLDLNPFITTNNTLMASAGDKIQINVYNATGNVEDLTMGQGNSADIEVTYTAKEYKVGVTQGRFSYYDEQVNKDPNIVDIGVQGVAAKMTNDMTSKIITELGKATLTTEYATSPNFDTFVDGLAKLNFEDESGIFAFLNVKTGAALKKAVKDDLKYIENFVRTGYLGTLAGVNLYTTKAMPDDAIYMATRQAVTAFVKRGAEVEYLRDPDKRNNQYWLRKTQVIALTDATQAVKITKQAG